MKKVALVLIVLLAVSAPAAIATAFINYPTIGWDAGEPSKYNMGALRWIEGSGGYTTGDFFDEDITSIILFAHHTDGTTVWGNCSWNGGAWAGSVGDNFGLKNGVWRVWATLNYRDGGVLDEANTTAVNVTIP